MTEKMKKRLITVLILVLAVAFYVFGMILPATILLLIGIMLDMTFWVRLFRPEKRKPGY